MTLYSAVFTLVLVMDPIGNIPVFILLLKKLSPRRRLYVIVRESFIAFLILTFFLFSGKYILTSLGLSHAALEISGGIILFLIALKMIFPVRDEQKTLETEPLIVPLAIPMIAGPSSLATVLLFSNQHAQELRVVFLTVLIASLISTGLLLLSEPLRKMLGTRGLIALERLMGMILTIVAVQMFLIGITESLKG